MKKNIFLFIFMLLSVYQTYAQVPTVNGAIQVWADFDRERGQLTFHARNIDFCDYYVRIFFLDVDGFEGMSYNQGISAIVSPGSRQIRTYRARAGATRHVYRYNYRIYQGNSAKKPNTDFVYALPVAINDTVKATLMRVPGALEGSQLIFDLHTDTIYACRGGVMCDGNSKAFDMSEITIYHADGTFCGYVFKGKSLATPGEKIKMGSPIAVVDRDSEKHSVCLSTYFLDKDKMRSNYPNPFKHTHFLPFFQTANEGKAQLKNEKVYTCELTDEIRMQDMSKREKKKFLKIKANEKDYKK